MIPLDTVIQGDCLEELRKLPAESIDCCVCSPPYYGLRDYGVDGQIGLEATPEAYVSKLVEVFREVRRALKKEGTLWLNLGDSYAGSGKGSGGTDHGKLGNHANEFLPGPTPPSGNLKPKDLIGVPWMVAFALRADGWWLRSDIIWAKPNCMPESVTDRPTKSHEYIFLLSKSQKYYYDSEAIKDPCIDDFKTWRGKRGQNAKYQDAGQKANHLATSEYSANGRNKRTVWTVATKPYSEAHFATFPEALIEPCIKAGCPAGGIVLDPFFGAGTTGLVSKKLGRHFIGVELNDSYIEMAKNRIAAVPARLEQWSIA